MCAVGKDGAGGGSRSGGCGGGQDVWILGGKCDGGDREVTFDDLWMVEVVGRGSLEV
jgi:hypothetical protein